MDRAYHKHYRRLLAMSDAREKELLAEAAKTQGEKQNWGMTLLNVTSTLTYESLARVGGFIGANKYKEEDEKDLQRKNTQPKLAEVGMLESGASFITSCPILSTNKQTMIISNTTLLYTYRYLSLSIYPSLSSFFLPSLPPCFSPPSPLSFRSSPPPRRPGLGSLHCCFDEGRAGSTGEISPLSPKGLAWQ